MDSLTISDLNTPSSMTMGKKPPSDQVDKASFVTLLVTQLKNQDPLEPVENSEFIAQLAQFQTLEGQTASNQKLEELVSIQQSQLALAGLSQAAILVGKQCTWEQDGAELSGTISKVTVEQGVMMVTTENGKVPVGALTGIGNSVGPGGTTPGGGTNGGTNGGTTTPGTNTGVPTTGNGGGTGTQGGGTPVAPDPLTAIHEILGA